MKKAVLTVIAIVLAVLLTSAFTILAVRSPSEKQPEDTSDPTEPTEQIEPGDTDEPVEDGGDAKDPEDTENPEDMPTEDEIAAARLRAARALEELGIMKGVGTLEDGSPDYALDKTLTRAEAMTFIARAMGYVRDGENGDYPHDFVDVAAWASGSVGFSYRNGITTGDSDTTFSPNREVTGMELVTFALRGLGHGEDFDWQDACAYSDEMGLTGGQFGDGTEAVTRGQTAELIFSMLKLEPKGSDRTLLGRLVEAGLVDRETVESLELTDDLGDVSEGTYTAAQALADYTGAAVNVLPRDIMQKSMRSVHGFIIAENTVAVPISAINGASYISITDLNGRDMGYKGVIGCDEALGIAYLSCTAQVPQWLADILGDDAEEPAQGETGDTPAQGETGDTPAEGENEDDTAGDTSEPDTPDTGDDTWDVVLPEPEDTVYIVSDMAVANIYGSDAWNQALAVVSDSGEFLGVSTLKGPTLPTVPTGEARELYDVGLELWPELCPPVRPRGIDPTKPMTAITYDDGPSKAYTPKLLDLLEKYNTVATFFEVGTMVKSNPQFLTRMEALGCEIGNHSWDHSNLKKLSAQGVRSQIERTEELIKSYTGHDVALVRCPGGNSNATVAANVGHPMIYWTIDTRDWEHRNTAKVIAAVQNDKNLDGDIILMHSLYKSTYDASVTLIPWIINKGYQPVTVSELAFFRGVELQNGVVYYKFPPQ